MIADSEDTYDLLIFIHAIQQRAEWDVRDKLTKLTYDQRKHAIITAIVEDAEVTEL